MERRLHHEKFTEIELLSIKFGPIKIRNLTTDDKKQVLFLDNLSGNNVSDTLDSENYAWGLFGKISGEDKLIGYCTIGGVEGTEHQQIAEELDEVPTSRTLSDVFVRPSLRNLGLGSAMISNLIKYHILPQDISYVFCTIHHDHLYNFYERLGFKEMEDGILYHPCKCETEEK